MFSTSSPVLDVRISCCCEFHGRQTVYLRGFNLPVLPFGLEEAVAGWDEGGAEVRRFSPSSAVSLNLSLGMSFLSLVLCEVVGLSGL